MASILAFAGSARSDSVNKKIVHAACRLARAGGAEVTEIDLRDYPMPLFDQDLEQSEGVPENGAKLWQLLVDHDGLLLGCPEYNSSITPLLKNVIDWVSRPGAASSTDAQPMAAFRGKVAALLSASPGALGGLRGLVHVRDILGNIGMHVTPTQLAVPGAYGAFGADGELTDEATRDRLQSMVDELIETTRRLHGR
ncbi:MAG: NADPH-dependent FMN reductase [Planctomycetota bacterium]|jgi:NAD(P)H-dependent FMN reductase